MEFNYDLAKTLLEAIKEHAKPEVCQSWSTSDLRKTLAPEAEENLVIYHLELLKDAGFVKGDFNYGNSVVSRLSRLTWEGVQALEAMKNEPLSNKIKKKLKEVGIKALHDAPAIAIGALLGTVGMPA